MAAPMRRRVPWINSEEFEATFHDIYSNDLTQMKHALNMLRVWKVRQPDHLAIGIELTSELLSVKVRDLEENEQEYNDIVRLAYGMAIVRFVNHWLEPLQQKECAQPVHLLAKREGIPLWIVDLRHEATHRNLPSLLMLRIAADFVLNYLMMSFKYAALTVFIRPSYNICYLAEGAALNKSWQIGLKNKYWLNNVIPESNFETCVCTGLRDFKQNIIQIFSESLGRQQEDVPSELLTDLNMHQLLIEIERSATAQCMLHGSRSLRENTRKSIVQWMKTSFSTASQAMDCESDRTRIVEEELSKMLGLVDSHETTSDTSRWQTIKRDEEEDWTQCPLGIYPGQRIKSVELPAVQEVSQRKTKQSGNQYAKYFSSAMSDTAIGLDADVEDSNYELTSISKVKGIGNLVANKTLSFY